MKDSIQIYLDEKLSERVQEISALLEKQVNASISFAVPENKAALITVLTDNDQYYIQSENQLDQSLQKEELLKDLAYYEGFLQAVEKKLNNERFMLNAKPDVIELERKKKADAESKILSLKESLALLS
jgi:valyl-tRNA synthetase